MNIVNVRIDERLIHGQVAAVWTAQLRAERIVVVDEEASKNDIQKSMLKMACPSSAKLSIFSPKRAVERLSEDPYGDARLFFVIKNPQSIKEMVDLGFNGFKEINVGNMAKHGPDAVTVKNTISVTPEEANIFRELNEKGIAFTSQTVPTEPKINFVELIKEVK